MWEGLLEEKWVSDGIGRFVLIKDDYSFIENDLDEDYSLDYE